MLKVRIIPCLDVDSGRVRKKGINFISLRDAGDPVEQATVYSKEGADEITFLDITATHQKRKPMLEVIKTAEQCFVPLTVGGGIQNMSGITEFLLAGADKVSMNSAAIKNPNLIKESSNKFGNQCIVVAIDAKKKIKKLECLY